MSKKITTKQFNEASNDAWDIFSWFINKGSELLKRHAENCHSWPEGRYEEIKTFKDWKDKLLYISHLLDEANEDKCSMVNEYADQVSANVDIENGKYVNRCPDDIRQKFIERENEIWHYRDNCKNEALDLFKRYFWDLWD
ncbi:MAG: hypothetical protein PUC68_08135 [Firmicutes bacterium]|nr:hypothetical protein [Bacillota bacterium]